MESFKNGPHLLRGNTDCLVLAALSRRPMYGSQIIREIEEKSHGHFRSREGVVYPALHRLEREGLVRGEWHWLANGRERKCYCITERGKQVGNERSAVWRGFASAFNLILSQGR